MNTFFKMEFLKLLKFLCMFLRELKKEIFKLGKFLLQFKTLNHNIII
ncbi:hypothetical protein BFZC1_14903 [Lysinibacillus fusiformis ZC1]|nr:hypothetical protein BFZC1_14903 [Lysinibacillus fusiformis ZC1]